MRNHPYISILVFITALLGWAVLQAGIVGMENDQHDTGKLTTISDNCYYLRSAEHITEHATNETNASTLDHQSSDHIKGHMSILTVTAATADTPYENFRGVFHNEIYPAWVARQGWIDRVTHYCRCMGMPLSDEDIAYFVDLAIQGGYDPRLWCCFAMAENKVPPNIYGYCGGSGSEWAIPSGGWRAETEYLHNRITTFYALHVDISRPENVLWFHHEGDPAPANPRAELFYCDNVMRWLENI